MKFAFRMLKYAFQVVGMSLIFGMTSGTSWANDMQNERMPSFRVFDAERWDHAAYAFETGQQAKGAKGPSSEQFMFSATEKKRMDSLKSSDQSCIAKTMNTLRHSKQFMNLAPYLRQVTVVPHAVTTAQIGHWFNEREITTKGKFLWIIPTSATEGVGFNIGYSATQKSMFFYMTDCEKAQHHLDREIGKVRIEKSRELAKDAAEKDQREFAAKQIIEDVAAIQNAVKSTDSSTRRKVTHTHKKVLAPAPENNLGSDEEATGSKSGSFAKPAR